MVLLTLCVITTQHSNTCSLLYINSLSQSHHLAQSQWKSETAMPFFLASSSSPLPSSASSSIRSRTPTKQVETWEFQAPRWCITIALLLLSGTLTIVYRCDHFGPDEYNFRGHFCMYYTTLWLVAIAIACIDTNLRTTTVKEI